MANINDLAGSWATDALADAAFVAAGWAKSDGVQYYDTTLQVIKRWDATLAAWIVEAMPSRMEQRTRRRMRTCTSTSRRLEWLLPEQTSAFSSRCSCRRSTTHSPAHTSSSCG